MRKITCLVIALSVLGAAAAWPGDREQAAFRKAVREGDREGFIALLEAGLDVNEPYGYETHLPLWFYVVRDGREDLLGPCFEHGADAGRADQSGETALMHAVRCHSPAMVAGLAGRTREAGRLEARNEDGRTALVLAIREDKADYVRLLLEAGARADGPDGGGDSPLIVCIRTNRWEPARLLLYYGADVNRADGDGNTPAAVCAAYGRFTMLDMLRALGADTRAANRFGHAPRLLTDPAAGRERDAPVRDLRWLARDAAGEPAVHAARIGDEAVMAGRTPGLADGARLEVTVYLMERTGRPVEYARLAAAVKDGRFAVPFRPDPEDKRLVPSNALFYFDVSYGDSVYPGPPCVFHSWIQCRLLSFDDRPLRFCRCLLLGGVDEKLVPIVSNERGMLIVENLDMQPYKVVVGNPIAGIDWLARIFPRLR